MKRINLLLLLLSTLLSGYSQIVTHKEVQSGKKGAITQYQSFNGEIFQVGDTLQLGTPRESDFEFVTQKDPIAMFPTSTCRIDASGSYVVIKKIQASYKKTQVVTTPPAGYALSLLIINFDEAIKSHEISSTAMNSEKALDILRKAKEKLDLQLISQKDYDSLKNEMVKYIK